MVQEQPLQGVGVLVTRPVEQGHALQALIESAGGHAILFPAIAITAAQEMQVAARLVERLHEFEIAIFTSANAVNRAMELIKASGGMPVSLQVVAIGKASARALQQQGISPDIFPQKKSSSETLLAMDEMQHVQDKRIIIFRGEGGRTLLGETLQQRGAQVEYAEVYRRVKPGVESGLVPEALLHVCSEGGVDIVTVTSNEGLQNLYEMAGTDGREWLCKTPLLVVSERARTLANELGFSAEVMVAKEASDEALVCAIQEWRRKQVSSEHS
jgi:uroporphyrinogen-III synthase